jgi:hypothetical protein
MAMDYGQGQGQATEKARYYERPKVTETLSSANAGVDGRDRSFTEQAMNNLESANNEMQAVLTQLNERLGPVLRSRGSQKDGVGQARPNMDAGLPEAIMTQADILAGSIAVVRELISRLAI